jgi:hypothetical protein
MAAGLEGHEQTIDTEARRVSSGPINLDRDNFDLLEDAVAHGPSRKDRLDFPALIS